MPYYYYMCRKRNTYVSHFIFINAHKLLYIDVERREKKRRERQTSGLVRSVLCTCISVWFEKRKTKHLFRFKYENNRCRRKISLALKMLTEREI